MSLAARTGLVVAAVLAAALPAACASGTTMGPAMMSGAAASGGYVFPPSSCPSPAALAGTTVTVTLADMAMTSMMTGTAPLGVRMMLRAQPATVAAGTISILALNRGWRPHEVLVLPLAGDAVAGARVPGPDGTVDETGSLGEASATCAAGHGDGIAPGSASWLTVSLPAGRYELACNLPNHYADGMHTELDVR